MSKFRKSNFKIFADNTDKYELIIKTAETKKMTMSTNTQNKPKVVNDRRKQRSKSVDEIMQKQRLKPRKSVSDDEKEEDDILKDSEAPLRRVERFLSVCPLPDDVAQLAEQVLVQRRQSTIMEEDEDTESTIEKKKETLVKPKSIQHPRQNSFKKSNKFSYFQHGYGLSQEEKAAIISDIITNYNMDQYLNDFKKKDVVSFQLKKL